MRETWVQSLGWEDPLEKEMATHSSTPPRKFHGQRSLVGYSPWGHEESDTTERLHDSRKKPKVVNITFIKYILLTLWMIKRFSKL